MSILAATATSPALDRDSAWLAYLSRHSVQEWRPGEWNRLTQVFTGDVDNPATTVYPCQTPGCEALSVVRQGHCVRCRSARAKGQDPGPTTAFVERLCADTGISGCGRPVLSNGLCRRHANALRAALKRCPELTARVWAGGQRPFPPPGPCAVWWCDRLRAGDPSILCHSHGRSFRASTQTHEHDYAATVHRPLRPEQFTLARCSPVLAAEIIYGLQCRDRIGMPINPFATRDFVCLVEKQTSLADVDRRALHPKAAQMLDNLKPHVEQLHDGFTGRDAFSPDLWGPGLLMRLPSIQDDRYTVRMSVDWSVIDCLWLREIGKLWARDTLPRRQSLKPAINALRDASDALKGSRGYMDHRALGLTDMTAIVKHMSTLTVNDGDQMAYSKTSQKIGTLRVILAHARDTGYLADVPSTFAFARMHEVKKPPPDVDEPGRAIPNSLIELMNEHLHSFRPDYCASHRMSGWSNADYGLMWQTIYVALRDTGRRPGEITSLRFDCLRTAADGEPILIWDNHKSKRPGRRLPIFTSTADALRRWQTRLRELAPNGTNADPLFPQPSVRGHVVTRCVHASYYGQRFSTWVNTIPDLPAALSQLNAAGTSFTRADIVLYGFRHAYAQALADTGIHPDVLMQLMDHRSFETTMGYYRVGQQRKREAITVMNKLRSDVHGGTRPPADLTTYQRAEVSTLLGGCSEPANVKAGGKACPIRFQCGACSFYRPDPTYVPEIEDEVRRLRKDIAAAELCATPQVVENLRYNLGMMQAVLGKMNANLGTLTPEERAVYDVFHAEARKSRKLLRLNLTAADPGPRLS